MIDENSREEGEKSEVEPRDCLPLAKRGEPAITSGRVSFICLVVIRQPEDLSRTRLCSHRVSLTDSSIFLDHSGGSISIDYEVGFSLSPLYHLHVGFTAELILALSTMLSHWYLSVTSEDSPTIRGEHFW